VLLWGFATTYRAKTNVCTKLKNSDGFVSSQRDEILEAANFKIDPVAP
jgi:hypothetical protein